MAVFGQGDALKKRAEFLKNINMKMAFFVLVRPFLGLLPRSIGLGVVSEEGKNLTEKRIKKRVKPSLNIPFQGKSNKT